MLSWLKVRSPLWKLPVPKETPLSEVRFVVLDTELTSLDSRSNRLLSVGAVAMDGARIRIGEQFYRLVNPGHTVAQSSVLVHKLRPSDVAEGQPPPQVLADLQKFIANAVLVGHFIAMDLKVLRKELGNTAHLLDNPAVDTARVQEWTLRRGPYAEDIPHRLENLDLLSLAEAYGVRVREAHHALYDAFLTAEVWQKMVHAVQAKGIRNLGDLLRVGKV